MSRFGRIYFVECHGTDRIKIGFTTSSVEARVRQWDTTGTPGQLHILGHIIGTQSDERAIHKKFDADRVRQDREWFHATPELRRFIDGRLGERGPNERMWTMMTWHIVEHVERGAFRDLTGMIPFYHGDKHDPEYLEQACTRDLFRARPDLDVAIRVAQKAVENHLKECALARDCPDLNRGARDLLSYRNVPLSAWHGEVAA